MAGLLYELYMTCLYVVCLLGVKETLAIWLICCPCFTDATKEQRRNVTSPKSQSNW